MAIHSIAELLRTVPGQRLKVATRVNSQL